MAVGRNSRLISATVLKARFVIVAYVNDVCIAEHGRAERRGAERSKWNKLCRRGGGGGGGEPARIVFEAQRSGGDEHEEGSGGERWNYASVHLTECDQSDRNSRRRPSSPERDRESRAWSRAQVKTRP